MTDDVQRLSYEEVPYESHPHRVSHPDTLATVATLHGMSPWPVTSCRVLELGCAGGGNIIPMALALPESSFVGIDLSPSQVADGMRTVEAIGLTNIELRAQSILEIGDDLGLFDYIVCHGVYSWVPSEVREKILAICERNLKPQGVAYISYNTRPGWNLRGVARDLMVFHARRFEDPAERAREARGILSFVANAATTPDGYYAQMLKAEEGRLQKRVDSYLLHEFLEDVNEPIYFQEFAERAASHRLQFLSEAKIGSRLGQLPAEVLAELERLTPDLIRREQFIDFLGNSAFRQTLLCHANVPLKRPPGPEAFAGLVVVGLLRAQTPSPDQDKEGVEEFASSTGVKLSTNHPFVKSALTALAEAGRRGVPFEDLCAQARAAHSTGGTPVAIDQVRNYLAESLMQCAAVSMVELHTVVDSYAGSAGERPIASPLARRQASTMGQIFNLRHLVVELIDFDRELIGLLDGSRDRVQLLSAMEDAVAAGKFGVFNGDRPVQEPAVIRASLGQALEPALQRLADCALLLG